MGIGLRLAAKAVQQHAGAAVAPNASRSSDSSPSAPAPRNSSAQAATRATSQVKSGAGAFGRGAKRFGEAVWGPMAHTGGVLWLEITGLFFALFAAFFAQNLYKFRNAYRGGLEHTHFLIYAALTLLFAFFAATQFYKARRKEKRNRARSLKALSRS